jgi:hypothetical protein
VKKAIEPLMSRLVELTQEDKYEFNSLKEKMVEQLRGSILLNSSHIKKKSFFIILSFFQLIAEGKSDKSIKDLVSDRVMNEYVEKLEKRLAKNDALEEISPGLGQLLSTQMRTVVVMQQVKEHIEIEMQEALDKYRDELKKKYKIRSLIHEWLNDLVDQEKASNFFFSFDLS